MNQTGHESTREPVASATRTPNGESVETALQLAIDLHGPVLLNRPDKLRLHLEAQCPQAGFDISFLLVALEERVPQSLLAMNSAAQMQVIVPQLQEMLAERRGLNPFAATWAVATWAAALRMDLFGNPAVLSNANAAVPGAVSGGARPPAADAPRPFSADPTTAAVPFSVPFSVPFGIPAKATPPDAGPALSAKELAATDPRTVVPVPARPPEADQVPVEASAASLPAEPDGEAIALPIPEPVPSAPAPGAAGPTVDTPLEAAPVASVAPPPVACSRA